MERTPNSKKVVIDDVLTLYEEVHRINKNVHLTDLIQEIWMSYDSREILSTLTVPMIKEIHALLLEYDRETMH